MTTLPLPQIGETWTHALTQVSGIVAKVSGTVVTFVSLTGNRVSIQFERPGGSRPEWELTSPAPSWYQSCSREACTGAAFIRYSRPSRNAAELVCPAHVPKGVKSEIPVKPFLVTEFFHGSACLACSNDGIEVLGELHRLQQARDSLWCCSVCSEWWLIASWDGFSDDFTAQEAALRCPAGFIFQSIVGKEARTSVPGLTFRVRVRVQRGHVLTGARPPTIWDHLKDREFNA